MQWSGLGYCDFSRHRAEIGQRYLFCTIQCVVNSHFHTVVVIRMKMKHNYCEGVRCAARCESARMARIMCIEH